MYNSYLESEVGMKAISLKQPYAGWIATGEKTLETRTWRTSHRGSLLIVSCATPSDLGPAGVSICTVNVTGCRRMAPEDEARARVPFDPKLWVWELEGVVPVAPVPVRGLPGLYEIDEALVRPSATLP